MALQFRPVSRDDVAEFVTWRYDEPYDVYDIDLPADDAFEYFSEPAIGCRAIVDGGELVGYCTFGEDARVPGGDYSAPGLDIGAAIRPDLTGRGDGSRYVAAIVGCAVREYDTAVLRVSIAANNVRAMKVWRAAGFEETQRFDAPEEILGTTVFVMLEKRVG